MRPVPKEASAGTGRFVHRAPGIKLQLEIRTHGLAFTGELGWSRVGPLPKTLDLEAPGTLIGRPTGLFRVTTLWSPSEIWYEIPPPPRPPVRSVRQMARDWAEGVPLDHAERELPKLVSAFVAKLHEHAVPYVRHLVAS